MVELPKKITFGKISTGALNDLEKVTKQAYAMVAYFGLNKVIGNVSYYDSTGQNEYNFTKPFSEKTSQTIDEEVSKIIEKGYQRAKEILTQNKEKLEILALRLIEKEVIFKEDVEEIFGKRPFESEDIESISDIIEQKNVSDDRNNQNISKNNDSENDNDESSQKRNNNQDTKSIKNADTNNTSSPIQTEVKFDDN